MIATVRAMIQDDSGATMVEYSILVLLIAAVSIGVITTLGQSTRGLFQTLNGKF